jgi:hypothetical protein
MAELHLNRLTEKEALNLMVGGIGFKRLTAGTYVAGTTAGHEDVTEYVLIKAKNANATYGTGCVAAIGDAPANADVITQDEVDAQRLTTLVVASGVVYAYYV